MNHYEEDINPENYCDGNEAYYEHQANLWLVGKEGHDTAKLLVQHVYALMSKEAELESIHSTFHDWYDGREEMVRYYLGDRFDYRELSSPKRILECMLMLVDILVVLDDENAKCGRRIDPKKSWAERYVVDDM